jgi:hypothetical protein
MIKLKLNELDLFEEAAGMPFSRASKRLMPRFCQRHRLEVGECQPCKGKRGICTEHTVAFQWCTDCEMGDIPPKVLAALGWLLRRREQPELTFEEFWATAEIDEVMAELGNA